VLLFHHNPLVNKFQEVYPLTTVKKTDTMIQIMKTDLHPTDYRPVVFSDDVAGFAFLTQSTAPTNDTIKWEDGNEYPLVKMHISSASHPYFTGEEKIIDTEGRVDRYKAKFAAAEARKEQLASKAKKAAAVKAKKTASDK
jgi:large subunit ribosomal protein L31